MSSHQRSNASPLRQQAARVRSDVQVLGGMARTSAREAVGRLKERGAEALDAGRQNLKRAERGFEQRVADNPVRSVLVAAGIGALLGYALRRRS